MKGIVRGLIIGGMIAVIGIAVLLVGLYLNGWKFTAFNENYTMETYTATEDNTSLDLEVAANKCNIVFYDGEKIEIEYPVAKSFKFEFSENSGTLKVSNKSKWYSFSSCGVNLNVPVTTVKLPKGITYNVKLDIGAGATTLADGTYGTVYIDIGAGAFNAGTIVCDELKCDVSAGALNIDSIQTEKVKLDVSAGALKIDKIEATDIDVDVSAGSVNLGFAGAKTDYTILVEKSAGSCNVQSQTATTGTKRIDIDVSAGSINASFEG